MPTAAADSETDDDSEQCDLEEIHSKALAQLLWPGTPSPRTYQLGAFRQVCEQNTIVNLDTGLGKKLIAVMCIDHHLKRYPSKKVLMCVTTPQLAKQQASYVQERSTVPEIKVKDASDGALAATAESWTSLVDDHQVLVVTGQLAEQAVVEWKVVALEQLSLLILDECHHAVGSHPFASLMQKPREWEIPGLQLPRVLGLTASHLKGRSSDVCARRAQLEATLRSGLWCTKEEEPIPSSKSKAQPKAPPKLEPELVQVDQSQSARAPAGGVDQNQEPIPSSKSKARPKAPPKLVSRSEVRLRAPPEEQDSNSSVYPVVLQCSWGTAQVNAYNCLAVLEEFVERSGRHPWTLYARQEGIIVQCAAPAAPDPVVVSEREVADYWREVSGTVGESSIVDFTRWLEPDRYQRWSMDETQQHRFAMVVVFRLAQSSHLNEYNWPSAEALRGCRKPEEKEEDPFDHNDPWMQALSQRGRVEQGNTWESSKGWKDWDDGWRDSWGSQQWSNSNWWDSTGRGDSYNYSDRYESSRWDGWNSDRGRDSNWESHDGSGWWQDDRTDSWQYHGDSWKSHSNSWKEESWRAPEDDATRGWNGYHDASYSSRHNWNNDDTNGSANRPDSHNEGTTIDTAKKVLESLLSGGTPSQPPPNPAPSPAAPLESVPALKVANPKGTLQELVMKKTKRHDPDDFSYTPLPEDGPGPYRVRLRLGARVLRGDVETFDSKQFPSKTKKAIKEAEEDAATQALAFLKHGVFAAKPEERELAASSAAPSRMSVREDGASGCEDPLKPRAGGAAEEAERTAVFLDSQSSDALAHFCEEFMPEGIPKEWTRICDHMMICTGALTSQEEELQKSMSAFRLGQEMELKVISLGRDENAIAVGVEGCGSCNKIPHITVATAPGSPPNSSNNIEVWTPIATEKQLVLTGVLQQKPGSQPSKSSSARKEEEELPPLKPKPTQRVVLVRPDGKEDDVLLLEKAMLISELVQHYRPAVLAEEQVEVIGPGNMVLLHDMSLGDCDVLETDEEIPRFIFRKMEVAEAKDVKPPAEVDKTETANLDKQVQGDEEKEDVLDPSSQEARTEISQLDQRDE